MAYEESLREISLNADATVGIYTGVPGLPGSASPNNGKQYCFVKLTGERTVGLATGAAGELVAGVLQNKPQSVGAAAAVGFSGVSKVQVGVAAVAAGAAVIADGNGCAVTGAAGRAVALASGAAGSIIPILLLG